MEIQKHFVAYIDILGFGEYVKDNLPTPEKPLALLQQFINISKTFNVTNELKIKAFSDSMVISMLAEEPIPPHSCNLEYRIFISYINTMQAFMITKIGNLPIRGGITFGDLHHDKSEILFGEALVEAYKLEHQHAFYPRILVTPKLLDPNTHLAACEHLARTGLAKNSPVFNFKQSERQFPVAYDYDNDGVLYCNYLSSLFFGERGWATYSHDSLNQHRLFVERRLQGTSDMNILRKYTWMKSYHNWFCEPFEEFHKYIIQDR